jgi:energy-coupling factor transport system ATP-binding protein
VLVSIKNLNFNFKKNSSLICNINLKLKKGEIIALLGHNGAGKTTFAKILAGLIKEISGEIYFEKEKVNIKKRLKYTSLVLQDPDYQLFSESVENEFKLGKYSKNFNNEELDIILEKLDLLKFKNRHPSTLSGGQKQRLTIALSIVKDSKLVIMDEPTSGLDYTNMMKIVDILNDMKNKGKSIIVITHDFEFLLNACDRVIHLKKGKIDNDLYLTENNFNEIKKIYEEDINEKEGV